MDVAPENSNALQLYHKLGYDRLSMIVLRKDFDNTQKEKVKNIFGLDFRY